MELAELTQCAIEWRIGYKMKQTFEFDTHPELSRVTLSKKEATLRRMEQLFGLFEPEQFERFESEESGATSDERFAFWRTR